MEELCIGGGGCRVVSFLGALYELDKNNLISNVKKYSGSSIGAFVSVLLLIGYTPKELIDIIFNTDFASVKDVDIKHLFTNKSLLRGEKLKCIIQKIILKKEKLTTTLKELHDKTQKELHIAVTCVSTCKIEYMSYITNPDLEIYKLICMAISVPLIFPPEIYNGNIYADGGIIDNLPLCVLKENSWGITSLSKIDEFKEFTLLNYIFRILGLVYNNLQLKINENYKNIIEIDSMHIGVVSFDITCDEKLMLIHKGRQAVRDTLEKIKTSLIN